MSLHVAVIVPGYNYISPPVLGDFIQQQMNVEQVSRVKEAATRELSVAHLLSRPWRDGEEHWNLSEDSS